jgi:hypothetical protein
MNASRKEMGKKARGKNYGWKISRVFHLEKREKKK